MNTKIRVCCLLLLAATTLTATPLAAASTTGHDDCSRLLADTSRLPRTADAAEGWFLACHARHDRLRASADGAAGWLQ